MSGRIAKGIVWSGVQQYSSQIISFMVSLFLARILTPSEFGVVAVSLLLLQILQIVNEMGFGAALMQKLDRDESDLCSVFILNMLMGVVLYGILFVVAPLMAIIFNQNAVTPVTRLIGLNLIISSFVVVQRTLLIIKVDFKTYTKASLLGAVISGIVGVSGAMYGLGVYALVLQSLLNNFVTTVSIWLMVSWRPRLLFSYERLVGLFNYAYKLIGARLINTIFQEMYSFVVGIFYSPTQLAFYNRANSFPAMSSTNIVQAIQRVSTPILCEKQDSNEAMSETLLKFIQTASIIIFPLLTGLIVLADPIIRFLLTDKWIESAWIMQVLCVSAIFYLFNSFNLNVFNATGKTGWAFKCETIKKILAVAIIAIAVITKSFKLLVWAQVVISVVEYFINAYFTKRQIGLDIFTQLKSVFKIAFSSIVMGIVVFVVAKCVYDPLFKIAIGICAGALVYVIEAYVFNFLNAQNMLKNLAIKFRRK